MKTLIRNYKAKDQSKKRQVKSQIEMGILRKFWEEGLRLEEEQEKSKEKSPMSTAPPAIDHPAYEQGLYLVLKVNFRVEYDHEEDER